MKVNEHDWLKILNGINLPPKTKELLCPVLEKGRWIAEHWLKTLSQAAKHRKSKMKIKAQSQARVLAFFSFFLEC